MVRKAWSWNAENPQWQIYGLFKRTMDGGDGWAPSTYHDTNQDLMWVFREGEYVVSFRDVKPYSCMVS